MEEARRGGAVPSTERLFWHVTITVCGDPGDPAELRAGLERLAAERPFLLSARYGVDRAEVRYWEEAAGPEEAVALALRLWDEHRDSAGLPPWRVVGVEVMERAAFRWRAGRATTPPLVSTGQVVPF